MAATTLCGSFGRNPYTETWPAAALGRTSAATRRSVRHAITPSLDPHLSRHDPTSHRGGHQVCVPFRWTERVDPGCRPGRTTRGHRGAAPTGPNPGVRANGARSPATSRPRPAVGSRLLPLTHSAQRPSSGRGDQRRPPELNCRHPPRRHCTAEPGWPQDR